MDLQSPPTRTKQCLSCGTSFACTAGNGCWCGEIPPVFAVSDAGCKCPECLVRDAHAAIAELIQSAPPGSAAHARWWSTTPQSKRVYRNFDFTIDPATGYQVMTAWHHYRRGYCCSSGCRNCPYGVSGVDVRERPVQESG